MPRMDGTGPEGHGPMTGRSFGMCNREPVNNERYIEPDVGMRFGRGMGPCGRGMANRFGRRGNGFGGRRFRNGF